MYAKPNLSTANSFDLVMSKNLWFGKELKQVCPNLVLNLQLPGHKSDAQLFELPS